VSRDEAVARHDDAPHTDPAPVPTVDLSGSALAPQVVERGLGVVPYRARKPPQAITTHLCGIGRGILVLRCHDLHVAAEAVVEALDRGDVPADLVDDVSRLVRIDGRFRVVNDYTRLWVRYVPTEYGNPDAGGVWERELRGTVGATPAVLFTAEPLPKGPTDA
jgi:hypothetical protein